MLKSNHHKEIWDLDEKIHALDFDNECRKTWYALHGIITGAAFCSTKI